MFEMYLGRKSIGMPFIDFKTRKKITIWEGISGSLYHSDQLTFGQITLEKDGTFEKPSD